MPPAIFREGGQTKSRAMLRINTPADCTVVDPDSNCLYLCRRDLKTALHRRRFENPENFAGGETSWENLQNAKECVDDSAPGAHFAVSDRVRNFLFRIFR